MSARTIVQINATDERMSDIAERFPSLRGVPGVRPWMPIRLAQWAVGGHSHGEVVTARFVLAVWNGCSEWPWDKAYRVCKTKLAPFDLFEARAIWDDAHLAAFRAWLASDWRFVP